MPLFYYRCDACQFQKRRLRSAADGNEPWTCPKALCQGVMLREAKGATANVVERLDSPHMVRAVERPADAERLYKERAARDPLKDD